MPPLGSAQASADAPPANKDQLLKLIRNFRVEDLLAELSHLPPGEERRMVIKLLALVWFRMDRPAALAWIATLSDPAEKSQACRGMVEGWGHQDPYAASEWVENLPEGPVKWEAGAGLIQQLDLYDPEAALKWALTCRASSTGEADLKLKAARLGGINYAETARIISASNLPENEKLHFQESARNRWNFKKAFEGEWDQMVPSLSSTK